MAAEPNPSSPRSCKALAAFLDEVTAFFHMAWTQHLDISLEAPPNQDLLMALDPTQNGNRIHRALETVVAAVAPASGETAGLLRDCVKIGGDLVIRIDRIAERLPSIGSASDVQAAFCDKWKRNDLAVLAARLDHIIERLSNIDDAVLSLKKWKGNLSCRLGSKAGVGDEYDNGDVAATKDEDATKQIRAKDEKQENSSSKRIALTNRPKQVPSGLLIDFILDALAYKSMYDREDEVTDASGSTFDWVFAKDPATAETNMKLSITNWFSTEESGPIYWITGKPGSGKSTFIRYLYHHRQTDQYIQKWADGRQIAKAGFFFWTSGSREQRSQTGLLRSLLHQLLSENHDLVASSFPGLWARLVDMPTKDRIKLKLDWSVEELLQAFLLFVKQASRTMKICLFIDGMDEFEGDHQRLIDLFKGLSSGDAAGNVKMCLSSRPWAVFQDAFEFSVPNLRLQDLTYDDMHRYINEKFAADADMDSLMKADGPAAGKLVENAIERANGVFLWVKLAVDKILERFKVGDGMSGVVYLLHSLPSNLDNLFAKLLFKDLGEDQLAEAASIYSLMRAREAVADFLRDDSANSLTVWELAFALDKEDDDLMYSAVGVERATDEFCIGRCTHTVNKISSRFSGLLDAHAKTRREAPSSDSLTARQVIAREASKRVVYIHRTVRDWLVSGNRIHEKLMTKVPAEFDPNLRLLRSYVLQMRRPIQRFKPDRMLDDWWADIALALTHAGHIKKDPENLQRSFVNGVDKVISCWWLQKTDDPYDHWARNAYGSYEVRMKAPPIWQPFLGLAVKFGLRKYVREEVTARNAAEQNGISEDELALQRADTTPLLAYATEFLCSRKKTIYPLSDPGLVEDLLKNTCRINPGANHEYADFVTKASVTPWITLLRHLRDARRRKWIKLYDLDEDGTKRWAQIVRLFLEVGGADADALVLKDIWDPEITAEGIFEWLDDTYGAVEIAEAKRILKKLQRAE